MIETLRSAEAIADWTSALVRVPSPQTDRMEAEPAVLSFIWDTVAPILGGLGFSPRQTAMGDLIVEIGPARGGESVLLATYAMTHPAASMEAPFAGERIGTPEGPAVRGRGAAEQKGAMAAALAALEAAARTELRGRLAFAVSTAGETGRHDSIRAILAELEEPPTLGIVAIGTGGRIALGNKGRIDFDVVVRGRSAHSSTPWLARNAIDGARLVLDRLAALDLGGSEHPALGRPTLTPTRIRTGPDATHTVQDIARITYDRRLLPGDDPEAALAAIRAALAPVAADWPVSVEPGPFMYPASIAADGRLVGLATKGLAECGLPPPGTFYSHGALDAGYLNHIGCEAAMWGPGDMALFHTDGEFVSLDALRAAAAGYCGLIRAALA